MKDWTGFKYSFKFHHAQNGDILKVDKFNYLNSLLDTWPDINHSILQFIYRNIAQEIWESTTNNQNTFGRATKDFQLYQWSIYITLCMSCTTNLPTYDVIESSTCDLTEPDTSHLTELSTLDETDQPTSSLRGSSHQLCDIEQQQHLFPNFPPQFISDLYMISRYNFTTMLECLL